MEASKSTKAVKQMSISTVPSSRNRLMLDDVMLLDDNIYNTINRPLEEDGFMPIGRKYPYKQMFFLGVYCQKGTIRTTLNLQNYELKDNDSLVCFAGAIISDFRISPDCKFYAIALSEEEFFNNNSASCIHTIRENMIHPQLIHNGPDQLEISLFQYKLLREIIITDNFNFKLDAAKGIITCMASGLAQWLLNHPDRKSETTMEQHQTMFLDFLQAVHTHCYKERLITFYADLFDISPKYFSKIIYDVSGKHAGDWIREHVTLEAKAMLNSGNASVQEVSEALNFPNASFFAKYFKSYTGISPKQYSMKARRGDI